MVRVARNASKTQPDDSANDELRSLIGQGRGGYRFEREW